MSTDRSFVESSAKFLRDHLQVPVVLEAWHSDPEIQSKWQKYGFACLFPFNENGLFYSEDGYVARSRIISATSMYSGLVSELQSKVEAGELSEEVLGNLMISFETGEFDPMVWEQDFPRQED